MFYVLQHEWRVFRENLNKQNFAAFCCLVLVYLKKKSVFLLVFASVYHVLAKWACVSANIWTEGCYGPHFKVYVKHKAHSSVFSTSSAIASIFSFLLLLLLSVSCCMKQQWERVGTLTALFVWVYFIHSFHTWLPYFKHFCSFVKFVSGL